MQTLNLPEHWFRDVSKVYVIESVDYYSRKGSTTIIIRYKSWWKLRRKLSFKRTRVIHNDGETHGRCPEALAILERLKTHLRPSYKKALFEQEPPMATLRRALPSFTDLPNLTVWPTERSSSDLQAIPFSKSPSK